uniref:Poly(3-hydroxyalkanoate) polymerase subunit PhaC n=1 Tax=Candidatus Kentrum sp. FM TaxID=2126340 RepID=A0A450TAB8_9GAMM|nr:MAG: polyhydroxyalkanoate synthase [Candidatus Kentron sp. FM]VFJ64255.1 MAG: polyhydroxyalkanoate synthase [Candidatus Kentron sp. FM]VFK10116.1 MAG: polyhydroxyalkanoate synthase [Candidatus Kentron sp. FM]
MLIPIHPDDVIREMAEINRKLTKGMEYLANLKEDDVDIATAPRKTIYTQDKLCMYRYTPVVEAPEKTPLLIIYALVNRYQVADLQPDRSLVRNLLKEGMDVHLIEWGDPQPADKYLTIDDYVNGYMDDCVDFLREKYNIDKVNVLGICQGGTLATCYTALHPEKIKNLVLTVTPIDFHAHEGQSSKPHIGLLFRMGKNANVDLMVDAFGNIPADLLNISFLTVSPFMLNFGKYIDMIDGLDNPKALLNFMRMEKWLFNGPDSAGEAYRQFVKDFLQENKLVKGEVKLGNKYVDLKNITMPILNVYATADHLVPPPCTTALGKHVASKQYEELAIETGHIGIYVGGKPQRILAPGVAKWLKERG